MSGFISMIILTILTGGILCSNGNEADIMTSFTRRVILNLPVVNYFSADFRMTNDVRFKNITIEYDRPKYNSQVSGYKRCAFSIIDDLHASSDSSSRPYHSRLVWSPGICAGEFRDSKFRAWFRPWLHAPPT